MKYIYAFIITTCLASPSIANYWEDAPTLPRGSQTSQLVYNSYADPLGDAFGQTASPDVTEFSVARNNNDLDITVRYELPNLPTKGLPVLDAVAIIELDVDADINTGTNQTTYNDYCSPQLAMGADYSISYPSMNISQTQSSGKGAPTMTAESFDSNMNFISTLPATQNADNFVVHVPLNLIGSPTDPIYLSAVAGNIDEPTDCSPDAAILALDNRGTGATAVPTLSVWMMLLLALMLTIVGVRKRQA